MLTLQHVHHVNKAIQVVGDTCWVGSIMVVGVLTCCALLHSKNDLKATQINVQHRNLCFISLHWATMLRKEVKIFVVPKVKCS